MVNYILGGVISLIDLGSMHRRHLKVQYRKQIYQDRILWVIPKEDNKIELIKEDLVSFKIQVVMFKKLKYLEKFF